MTFTNRVAGLRFASVNNNSFVLVDTDESWTVWLERASFCVTFGYFNYVGLEITIFTFQLVVVWPSSDVVYLKLSASYLCLSFTTKLAEGFVEDNNDQLTMHTKFIVLLIILPHKVQSTTEATRCGGIATPISGKLNT